MNEIAHIARCTSTRQMFFFFSILGSVIETPEVFIVFVSPSKQMLGQYLDQVMATSFTIRTNTRRYIVRVIDDVALIHRTCTQNMPVSNLGWVFGYAA